MKINDMIKTLEKMKKAVGGDVEVPVVRINYGENDYIIPEYGVIGKFEDQDGNTFSCAFVGEFGGEEFTKKNIAHYEWNPREDIV